MLPTQVRPCAPRLVSYWLCLTQPFEYTSRDFICCDSFVALRGATQMPARRGAVGIAMYRGGVTVFGGSNLSLAPFDNVWSYSVVGARWLQRAPMPLARSGHFAVPVGASGDVYIVGGVVANSSTTRAVDILGASGGWSGGTPLPVDDTVVGAVTTSDGTLLVLTSNDAGGAVVVTPRLMRGGGWIAGAASMAFPQSEIFNPVQGAAAVGDVVLVFTQVSRCCLCVTACLCWRRQRVCHLTCCVCHWFFVFCFLFCVWGCFVCFIGAFLPPRAEHDREPRRHCHGVRRARQRVVSHSGRAAERWVQLRVVRHGCSGAACDAPRRLRLRAVLRSRRGSRLLGHVHEHVVGEGAHQPRAVFAGGNTRGRRGGRAHGRGRVCRRARRRARGRGILPDLTLLCSVPHSVGT